MYWWWWWWFNFLRHPLVYILFSVCDWKQTQCVGAWESWIKERHWSSQKTEIILHWIHWREAVTTSGERSNPRPGPIPAESKRTIENVSVGWCQSVDRTDRGDGNYERHVIETTGEECGRDAANIGWPVKWTNSCLWALCSKLEVMFPLLSTIIISHSGRPKLKNFSCL